MGNLLKIKSWGSSKNYDFKFLSIFLKFSGFLESNWNLLKTYEIHEWENYNCRHFVEYIVCF